MSLSELSDGDSFDMWDIDGSMELSSDSDISNTTTSMKSSSEDNSTSTSITTCYIFYDTLHFTIRNHINAKTLYKVTRVFL